MFQVKEGVLASSKGLGSNFSVAPQRQSITAPLCLVNVLWLVDGDKQGIYKEQVKLLQAKKAKNYLGLDQTCFELQIINIKLMQDQVSSQINSLCLVISSRMAGKEYKSYALIPKDCMVIADELKKYAPQVKSWMIQDFCTQCGKPIPYSKAKPFIESATKELAETIIPYVRSKAPKLPKDITPEWVVHVSSAIEEAFSHHKDMCKFDVNNPQDKKEMEKAKQIAIQKAMPKAIGLLPMAGECKKLVGIPTLILHDIPFGKSKGGPVNIRSLIQKYSQQLCKSL
ncbi:uncharacterized protein BX664DRAFT_362467 [Halteromyces radiatus]|uniref:uncharacterized protein n=1 Tax=Halteromyces radiatus TaxID=101107 RepID=UPI00221E5278|nr:uncharacterized protein BX664DRAFT_362467 [Halteromyces radiatus]KAI8077671.1 hypothetical protein BX664DRAFT_362467 [Halteromyces radiatus]